MYRTFDCTRIFLFLSLISVAVVYHSATKVDFLLHQVSTVELDQPILDYAISKPSKPRGVFVLKVSRLDRLEKTLCTLTAFFNAKAKYPIRIFTDHIADTDDEILKYAGDVDVKVILNERWKDLPQNFTKQEREKVISRCQNFDDPDNAKCSSRNVNIGYVYNTYWSYMEMADEPLLQEFDYFVLFDDDAFLTKPMPDPFEIMEQNSLVGIYNIESNERGITAGVQKTAEASFSLEERRNSYLNSPEYSLFDDKGIWNSPGDGKPGVWMCFFGGRLDFLRSERFKEFARPLAFHTYMSRTSRQTVIPLGWSVLVGGDKVWYLPKRNIYMGVYHHGWVDDSEIIRVDDGSDYRKNTISRWHNFTESKVTALMKWKEYMMVPSNTPPSGVNWQQCIVAKGRKYGS